MCARKSLLRKCAEMLGLKRRAEPARVVSVKAEPPSIREIMERSGVAYQALAPAPRTVIEPACRVTADVSADSDRRTDARIKAAGSPCARIFTNGGPVYGYAAELTDISGTGCGLEVEASLAELLPRHSAVSLQVGLPDDPETMLELSANILSSAIAAGALRLGLRFCFDAPNASVLQCRLAAFAARHGRGPRGS